VTVELWLGGLVVVLALAFVAYPLLRPRAAPVGDPADIDGAADGTADRYTLYREMLDLDFEHRLGKLNDDDYRELSEACLARAAELLAREDARESEAAERAEREIAAMREALRSSRAVENSS
jgi:hypothetical protein